MNGSLKLRTGSELGNTERFVCPFERVANRTPSPIIGDSCELVLSNFPSDSRNLVQPLQPTTGSSIDLTLGANEEGRRSSPSWGEMIDTSMSKGLSRNSSADCVTSSSSPMNPSNCQPSQCNPRNERRVHFSQHVSSMETERPEDLELEPVDQEAQGSQYDEPIDDSNVRLSHRLRGPSKWTVLETVLSESGRLLDAGLLERHYVGQIIALACEDVQSAVALHDLLVSRPSDSGKAQFLRMYCLSRLGNQAVDSRASEAEPRASRSQVQGGQSARGSNRDDSRLSAVNESGLNEPLQALIGMDGWSEGISPAPSISPSPSEDRANENEVHDNERGFNEHDNDRGFNEHDNDRGFNEHSDSLDRREEASDQNMDIADSKPAGRLTTVHSRTSTAANSAESSPAAIRVV